MNRLILALGAALLASCGLIDSSVTDFTMTATKDFAVDTAQWNLSVTESTFPTVPCGGDAECATVAAQVCGGGCTATCVASNCQAHVTVSLFETFDLLTDSPELSMANDVAFVDVVIDSVDFVVDPDDLVCPGGTNTLNTTIPPLEVYLAPIDVVDPADPQSNLLGTIPSVAPGQMGTISMLIEDAGRTVLSERVRNYTETFNMIITTVVDISAGDPVPSGMLSGCVLIKARADLI